MRAPGTRAWIALGLLVAGAAGVAGCGGAARDAALRTGGDVARGRAAIARYGCGSCHAIPGIRDATATVGPPLAGIARRSYVGGVVPNTPPALIRWIVDPPAVDSLTAMPNVGVTELDARDIAAFLYTLR